MSDRTCPECERSVEFGVARCSCGHCFYEGPGWSEDLDHMEFPTNFSAWFLIGCVFLGTLGFFALLAWLDWFQLGDVASALLPALFIICPLAAQYLPTLRRRNGGCCMGCLAWLAAGLAVFVASVVWGFSDPVTTREQAPIARFDRKVVTEAGGISLAQSREEIEMVLGPGAPASFPYVPKEGCVTLGWPGGHVVTFLGNSSIRVEGPNLTQSGKALISQGDPLTRVSHLFETSSYATRRRSYTIGDVNYLFRAESGRVTRVVMTRVGHKFVYHSPAETINGLKLGVLRSELGPGKVNDDGSISYGKTRVNFDAAGRSRSIVGTTLERNGDLLLKVGEPASKLGASANAFVRPARFGEIILQLPRDKTGLVRSVVARLP